MSDLSVGGSRFSFLTQGLIFLVLDKTSDHFYWILDIFGYLSSNARYPITFLQSSGDPLLEDQQEVRGCMSVSQWPQGKWSTHSHSFAADSLLEKVWQESHLPVPNVEVGGVVG